jgi:predicted nucleic acid-binding protein
MPGFDFDAALRWARLGPRRALARRSDNELPFVDEDHLAGQPLLLDTCVYIDQMQGRAPAIVELLVEARHVNHSTIAVQELMHTVGVLKPDDRRTAAAIAAIETQIKAMPEHRLFAPDIEVLGRAAILAGILSRDQGYARDDKLKALHDCVLFLQAQKLGFAVLTRNIAEFDLLLQLHPAGRVLFYRR